jgi:hypothetical protein
MPEDADRHRHEVQPVRIFADPEREARRAGVDIGADETQQQAERHHRERLDERAVRQRDRGDEADHHQREIFGRAELAARSRRKRRRKERDRKVDTVPAKNEPIAAIARAAPGAALARHLVTVDGGDGRRGFAGHVDQDRRGRAAILRAVIDAGEHDQRRDRFGSWKVIGSSMAIVAVAPMPGSTPISGAEQHADQAEEQVFQRCRRRETKREIIEKIHHSNLNNRAKARNGGTEGRGHS